MTQSSDKQKLNFYHYLSDKLRRSTRISSSEKSCNNTCEKYDTFSRVDIANQLLTDFRATRSGWWMKCKAFTIFNPRSFVGIFSDYGC